MSKAGLGRHIRHHLCSRFNAGLLQLQRLWLAKRHVPELVPGRLYDPESRDLDTPDTVPGKKMSDCRLSGLNHIGICASHVASPSILRGGTQKIHPYLGNLVGIAGTFGECVSGGVIDTVDMPVPSNSPWQQLSGLKMFAVRQSRNPAGHYPRIKYEAR